ncbi:hypothetical protein BH11BAC6_BH11BAC6_08490 [soil metagenome]
MKYVVIALLTFCFFSCKKSGPPHQPPVNPPDTIVITDPTDTSIITYRGADLSFLPEIEENNVLFYKGTTATPVLDIMKSYGCNLVRVRLWYQPANEHSGLEEVLAFCKTIHDKGMQIFLDFHYSDTWTDPANQATPAAWAALDINDLQDSVFEYSKRVIGFLKAQNTLPAIVQVGNETNGGMLWNTGKVYNGSTENWTDYASLVKKAIEGIRSEDLENKIKIMLHYGGIDGADYFFSHIKQQQVAYDMIGVSYYPWWSTTNLATVQQTLNALAATYNKPVMIAETAYPFTLQWNDNTNNVVGLSNQLITGYAATQEGQLAFLTKLRNIVANIPNNMGAGFCYWEPDWVAFSGGIVIEGSSWENLTLFDFSNKALPGMQAYHE